MDDPHRIDGHIAVVTGAAQGLGLGISERLTRNGATVVMADLQREKVEEVAAKLNEPGLQVRPAFVDVSDSVSVNRLLEEVAEAHGRLDILVNNAGAGQQVAPVVELDDREWDRVIRVTLTGTFYCCRAAGWITGEVLRVSGGMEGVSAAPGRRG